MGIDKASTKLLLKESLRRPFTGRLLTLGRMDVMVTLQELRKFAAAMGARLSDPGTATLADKSEFAALRYLSDQTLFRSIGFEDVAATDYSDFEGARYQFDLNKPDLPPELLGSFDVIIDSGTSEHVFHIPQVLSNIHRMLRVGGRAIHLSPSSNHIDHGFYMFSPTLFWDYYTANGYTINTIQVIRYTQRHSIDPWEVSNYTPGCLSDVSFGGLDDGMYAIYCIVTKREASTEGKVPQQGLYVRTWSPEEPPEKSKVKEWVKGIPVVAPAARSLLRLARSARNRAATLTRRKGLGLKVVARY